MSHKHFEARPPPKIDGNEARWMLMEARQLNYLTRYREAFEVLMSIARNLDVIYEPTEEEKEYEGTDYDSPYQGYFYD